MKRDGRDPKPSEDDFSRAMEGVKPLPRGAADDGPRRRPKRIERVATPTTREFRFDTESYGEQVEGLVRGADRKQLRQLRRGERPPEAEIDLHGLRERPAREAVHRFVREGFGSGLRSLLIIHGRGHHSGERAVLKQGVPEWLVEPRVAAHVIAFCTAPIEFGGAGAIVVLLRRNRAREEG